jgi:hypothetical protein
MANLFRLQLRKTLDAVKAVRAAKEPKSYVLNHYYKSHLEPTGWAVYVLRDSGKRIGLPTRERPPELHVEMASVRGTFVDLPDMID